MKAIVIETPGGLEQLRYREWPDPVLEPGEVLVKVAAAALNHADIWLRQGMLGALPMVPGIDGAGTVVETAADVARIRPGMRVLINPAITCDACEHCYAGDHGSCVLRAALGQKRDGTFADYVKLPWRNVLEIGPNISFEAAAAIPSAFFTAWQLLTVRGHVTPAQTVLVMAAASGVGSAAIQLAKILGARVIAAAGSPRKLECASSLGADDMIDYSREDLARRVLDLTEGLGVHVIIDAVGAGFWNNYFKCVRKGGRLVTCSFASGSEASVDIATLMRRQISIIGSGGQGSKAEALKVVQLLNEGRLTPVIDRIFPLSDAAKAQEVMEQRDVIGKIVLLP